MSLPVWEVHRQRLGDRDRSLSYWRGIPKPRVATQRDLTRCCLDGCGWVDLRLGPRYTDRVPYDMPSLEPEGSDSVGSVICGMVGALPAIGPGLAETFTSGLRGLQAQWTERALVWHPSSALNDGLYLWIR